MLRMQLPRFRGRETMHSTGRMHPTYEAYDRWGQCVGARPSFCYTVKYSRADAADLRDLQKNAFKPARTRSMLAVFG